MTDQGRAVSARLEWSVSFIQDVPSQEWHTASSSGSGSHSSQPYPINATPHAPSRVIDEDYDEADRECLGCSFAVPFCWSLDGLVDHATAPIVPSH